MRSVISVIIPTYNVADFLGPCLASLRSQTLDNFDVVVVDDGSTDLSGEIADQWAETDERFTVVHQDNSGPGPGGGRNGGLAHTKSDLLTFLDSDDALRPDALEMLTAALARNRNVDLATTSACRLVGNMLRPSHFHDISHQRPEEHTTAEDSPWLMFDSTPWNKAFRRDFFDDVVGHWPAQQLYEDIAPMTRALVEARSISVLTETHYLWRTRGEGSITHESVSIHGDLAQLEQLRLARSSVLATGNEELLRWLDWKSLTSDMLWMVRKLPRTNADERRQLHDALRTALGSFDPLLVARVQPPLRRCYDAIAETSANDAVQVIARNRLQLTQDRRTPTQATSGQDEAVSVHYVRPSKGRLNVGLSSSNTDLANSALILRREPPWSEDSNDAEVLVPAKRSSRYAANFIVNPADIDGQPACDLYVQAQIASTHRRFEVRRSMLDIARARLAPTTSSSTVDVVPFFDDGWLRLSIGERSPVITSAAASSGDLVLRGPHWLVNEETYTASLTETGSNAVTPLACARLGDQFEIVIDRAQREALGPDPYFISLAATTNPAVPIPVALASPETIALPGTDGVEHVRVDHGTQAQAFVQRRTTSVQRARHLVDEIRAKQILSGFGLRRLLHR